MVMVQIKWINDVAQKNSIFKTILVFFWFSNSFPIILTKKHDFVLYILNFNNFGV